MSIQALLDKVEDELSTDVWYVYGGGRHFAVEAIVLQFVAALILAYATGFVGVEDIAKRNREQFIEFLRRIRAEKEPTSLPSPDSAIDEAQALLQSFGSAGDFGTGEAAVEQLLLETGMPEPLAKQHATRIAQLVLSDLEAKSHE